jgi:hypothetical protein
MCVVDASNRGTLFLDRLKEIRPEEREVMAIGLLELGFLVHLRLPIFARIKGPTVPPADVEDSIRAVKVRADGVLLRGVAAKLPVFPDAGELFELVSGNLVIRRVGRLLFGIEDGSSGDIPSARAKDSLRILLLGPPQHLVEPVHPPIPERTIRVIEEVPPTARVHLAVEWTQRRGAAPLVPIHGLWRSTVRLRLLLPSSTIGKNANHADLAHFARFEEVHPADVMRPDPAMQPDLHDAA